MQIWVYLPSGWTFLQEVAAVPNESGFLFRGRLKLLRFQTAFAHPFCPRRRRCRPKSLSYRLFEDFRFNQLVIQIVEVVLHFTVGQFAVDQVVEVVVVIAAAVVGFQAVVGAVGLLLSDRILCAGLKANSSFPALVIRPSLSYSNRVVPVRWSVLWVRLCRYGRSRSCV